MRAGEGWITLARLGRPRGRKGELTAVCLSSRPERLRDAGRVFLRAPANRTAAGEPFQIEEAWLHQGRWILKFRGIDTISDAERWRGAEVCVPQSERGPAAAGEYYLADLIGSKVYDYDSGVPLGEVSGWREDAGQVWLEVMRGEQEALVPFAAAICRRIDPAIGRIEVTLPEGLWELHR